MSSIEKLENLNFKNLHHNQKDLVYFYKTKKKYVMLSQKTEHWLQGLQTFLHHLSLIPLRRCKPSLFV